MCYKKSSLGILCIFFVLIFIVDTAKFRHNSGGGGGGKQGSLKFLKTHFGIGNHVRRSNRNNSNIGLWPSVFNLATKAAIYANATCGETGRQEFCRMTENGKGRCGICDNFSPDPGKRHSIISAIDGSNRWWQSPPIYYSRDYEYITITIDLKQIYQIAYIIIKAANSPRPGTWILERSIDGITYAPWQYFARNDKECLERFGILATKGKPHYYTDSEVICTSFYSRLTPLENGEIHTSLIHGRPGANETSPELLEFTKARYVRLQLMGLRGTVEPLPRWFTQDIWKDKRLFYSIRDISIGGQCVCNGHAENCRHNVASGHPECECAHHTCGANCDKCCPMYNQRQWGPGSSRDARQCLPCNCHGHASSCHYDEDIDKSGLSMDINGNYQGGGVCDNCTDHTMGINCELCRNGYFRPPGVMADAKTPCLKCDCDPLGSNGTCIQYGEQAGTCQCLPGYAGLKCDVCDTNYRGYPNCEVCPCDPKGVIEVGDCEGDCKCKANVEGPFCDHCKAGYFGLSELNAAGCLQCYCSNVTTLCSSAIIKPQKISNLEKWLLSDLQVTHTIKPTWNGQTVFSVGNYELAGIESLYWLAPEEYLGNKLTTYNAELTFKLQWVVMRGDTSGGPTIGPNIILVGQNGIRIGYGDGIYTSSKMVFNIKLNEIDWYIVPDNLRDITTRLKASDYQKGAVTRQQFLSVLSDLKHILLRSTFHTDQIEALLEEATINYGLESDGYGSVEECSCPSGYTGLSCEKCAYGYVRITANDSNGLESFCGKCDCNGHSKTCNPNTGECFCDHNTVGEKCERCAPGFYGNPLRGTPSDCKRCACPLLNEENNFSPSCQLDNFVRKDEQDEGSYVCTQCPKGYTGDHCEICDDGFYGDPLTVGEKCVPCDCHGGPCDRKTGQCLRCKGNTEGWKCERCKPEYYGDAATYNCKACECDPIGSLSKQCDNITGQCLCKSRFTGRTCNICEEGYGNVTSLCTACSCNAIGSKSKVCNPRSGICDCLPGVEGFHCDTCQNFYYGFSTSGCKECNCHPRGSKHLQCQNDGRCICKDHFIGRTCSECENGFWLNDEGDCIPCNCNKGANDNNCGPNGKCNCKDGVGGDKCDRCLDNYYGNIEDGCKKCDTCRKGQKCDKTTGKCKCPPFTTGHNCEKCFPNAWGYEPDIGCKPCNCSKKGSVSQSCENGICTCKIGYFGRRCDECSTGYFGYPNCDSCSCIESGSIPDGSGIFTCDKSGQCNCKENVEGLKCSKCKPYTFGLSKAHPTGCIKCYCFDRSDTCDIASLHAQKSIISQDLFQTCKPYDHKYKHCIKIPLNSVPYHPNMLRSYSGYVSIDSTDLSGSVIYVTGNKIRIRSREFKSEFQLLPSNFEVERDPKKFCKSMRECVMAVLQNVTELLITFTDKIPIESVFITSGTNSIEKCKCPPQYTSLSCEDPNVGYYRVYPPKSDNKVNEIIGQAEPCACNGKSNSCDPNTGICKNCMDHTEGDHCEKCTAGYYKDGNRCKSCLCPSSTENNADSCEPHGGTYKCHCKKGYTGNKCDQCDSQGYYRDKLTRKCISCNCNKFGSVSPNCNENGTCICNTGYYGEKCNKCLSDRQYIDEHGNCRSCDECATLLFNQIDELSNLTEANSELFKNSLQPPWKKINTLYNKYKFLNGEFSDKILKAKNLTENNNLTDFEKATKDFNGSLSILAPGNVTTNVKDIQNRVQLFYTEIEKLHNKIRSITNTIHSSVGQQPDLKGALTSAKEILKYIENISRYIYSVNLNPKLRSCQNLNNTIEQIYSKDLDLLSIKTHIKELLNGEHLIEKAINKLYNRNKKLRQLNSANSKNIQNLKEKILQINDTTKKVDDDMKKIMHMLKASHNLTENVVAIHDLLGKMNLADEIEKLENVSENYDEQLLNSNLAQNVFKHVKNLNNLLELYKKQFQYNAEDLKKINASGAYRNIVKNIGEAKQNAFKSRQLLANIYDKIYPNENDSISSKSLLSQAASDRLHKRIKNLPNQEETLVNLQFKSFDTKAKLQVSGNDNNKINQKIQILKQKVKNFEGTLTDVVRSLNNDNVTILQRNLNHFEEGQISFKNKLKKYFELRKAIDDGEFQKNISMILDKLPNIDEKVFTDVIKNIKIKNDSISKIHDRISEIKGKINYAKDLANELKYPINLNNCSRTYELPRFIRELKKLYLNFSCTNGIILTIRHNKNKEQMQVYANHGKIYISSTMKNATKITDDAVNILQLAFEENEKSFSISTGGELIRRMNHSINIKNGYNLKFILGNATNDGSSCYVSHFEINSKRIGLWNFVKSEGQCDIPDGVTEIKLDGNFFDGFAYQVYNLSEKSPKQWNLKMDFATFDENSLLLLAFLKNETKNPSYVATYLKQGVVYCDLKFINENSIRLNSKEKYNDGNLYPLEISLKLSKTILTAKLKINDSSSERILKNFSSTNLFKIRKATIYVGQTDPMFERTNLPFYYDGLQGFIKTKFNGAPPMISPYVETRNITENLSYSNAWIRKNGHLTFGSVYKTKTISFDLESDHLIEFPRIQIETLNATYTLSNSKIPKDTKYDVIIITYNNITINNKIYNLNEKKNSKNLSDSNNIEWKVTIGSNNSEYIGHLKRIVTDRGEMYLNKETLIDFNNVDIGRNRIKRNNTISTNLKMLVTPETNSMQNTEGCAPVNQYATDENAVKFGDKPNSFLKLETQFWKRKYTLKFDLRTFYPNGLIVISLNRQGNSYYNSLQLEKGKIQLYVKGKRKKTLFGKAINDGNWHTIEITNNQANLNKKNKLTVILDNNIKNAISIPKNFIRGDVFIGDVPPTFNSLVKLRHNLFRYIGCMRSMEINGDQIEFDRGQNLGQCFPNIEQGAYFGGDSYAIYKNDFQINYNLELSFQFKTAEQNGVLLYIFDDKNSPAFSVELQNGAVVMTVDMGNGKSKVTNDLGSEFALCNNKWHNVTALYSNSELTVNIDGITKTWVQSDVNSLLDEVNAPLYIGGVPDGIVLPTGTNISNNFKGCIRKLKVENTIKDWTDMYELNNVLLNSCPTL